MLLGPAEDATFVSGMAGSFLIVYSTGLQSDTVGQCPNDLSDMFFLRFWFSDMVFRTWFSGVRERVRTRFAG